MKSMIYYVIAFAAGLGITLQTTLNSQLAKDWAATRSLLRFFPLRRARSVWVFTPCCGVG